MRTALIAALAAAALAGPLGALAASSEAPAAGTAAAPLAPGSVLGTTLDEVRATLTAQGYEVRKGEMEDGEIEVYFVKDGKMGEVYVSPATGQVVKLKSK